jgi:hypothetical protein
MDVLGDRRPQPPHHAWAQQKPFWRKPERQVQAGGARQGRTPQVPQELCSKAHAETSLGHLNSMFRFFMKARSQIILLLFVCLDLGMIAECNRPV